MGKYIVINDQKGKKVKYFLALNDKPSKYDTIAIELYNKTHVLEVIRVEHQEHATAIIYCKSYIAPSVLCDKHSNDYTGILGKLHVCYKTTGLSHFEDAYIAIQELQEFKGRALNLEEMVYDYVVGKTDDTALVNLVRGSVK